MAIDPNVSTRVGRNNDVQAGREAGGLGQPDQEEIRRAADGRGDVQGAALRAAGGNLTSDGFQNNGGDQVQVAQAGALVMPRPIIGPLTRPGPGLNVPNRPSIPLDGPSQMSPPREDRWTERGMHHEKQDGGVTPGGDDERNPDMKGRERRDAVEDGRDRANKLRREHEIRQQRQHRQQERNLWDRFRNWLTAPPPLPDMEA